MENITFGERSAQAYMRLAAKGNQRKIEDAPSLRRAIADLAIPRRYSRDALNAELEAFNAHAAAVRANQPDDVKDWSHQDAKTCADSLRAFDEIMHRYGICSCVDDPEMAAFCSICWDQREANTQRAADLGETRPPAVDGDGT